MMRSGPPGSRRSSAATLGLPDKTRTDEDDAGRQLDPAEEATGRSVPSPRDAAELSEEVMAPFHRLTDLTDPGFLRATAGGLQAEARRLGPPPGRPVAVGPVGPRRRQTPRIDLGG